MNTLDQALDDLDRMVDTGAEVPKIRNQISFIRGEVAALQHACLETIEQNAQTVTENVKLKEALSSADQATAIELAKINADKEITVAKIDAEAKEKEAQRKAEARRKFDEKVAAWNRAKTEKRHY